MEEKIQLLHPQGKKAVQILKRRYDMIRDTMLPLIAASDDIAFETLCDKCVEQLTGKFDGKILWYVEWVKLDLEAKGIIERVPKSSPHKLRMKNR